MNTTEFFRNLVEPSMARIGLFGITRSMKIDHRECVVTFKVSKNVLTDFDSRLSRYLAAVAGTGLPAASTEMLIQEPSDGRLRTTYPRRHVQSVRRSASVVRAFRFALGEA